MADDSDEEDLWADLDGGETTCALSENLKEAVSHDLAPVHKGDVDEGKLTWIAPSQPGLQNSKSVAESVSSHWYNEEKPAALLTSTPAVAAPGPRPA